MIKTYWEKHCKWLQEQLPVAYESLNPPATPEDFRAFELHAGYEMPDRLKELYSLANGQDPDAITGIWWGMPFIPIQDMIKYHMSKEEPIDMSDQDVSIPSDSIQLFNYTIKWIPFAEDGAFNYLAVDLDPAVNGKSGQIINCGRDERTKCVIAPDLLSFLIFMTDEIEKGNYSIVDDGFGEKIFNYKSAHLLDDLTQDIVNK